MLEDARPHHHTHGVLAVSGVQIADDVHQQLVGLFLVGVHLDDERLELLGLLEVAEVLHGFVERLAFLLQQLRELERILVHDMHVVHVEALDDLFKLVDDRVERLGETDDVLAVDRRDEIGRHVAEDVVVDVVAFVLDGVCLLHRFLERIGCGEFLDGLDEQVCLIDRKLREVLERAEIVVLMVPLAHSSTPFR